MDDFEDAKHEYSKFTSILRKEPGLPEELANYPEFQQFIHEGMDIAAGRTALEKKEATARLTRMTRDVRELVQRLRPGLLPSQPSGS